VILDGDICKPRRYEQVSLAKREVNSVMLCYMMVIQ